MEGIENEPAGEHHGSKDIKRIQPKNHEGGKHEKKKSPGVRELPAKREESKQGKKLDILTYMTLCTQRSGKAKKKDSKQKKNSWKLRKSEKGEWPPVETTPNKMN